MNLLNSKNKTKKKVCILSKKAIHNIVEKYIYAMNYRQINWWYCGTCSNPSLKSPQHCASWDIVSLYPLTHRHYNTPLPAPILNRVLIKGPNVNPMETTNVLIQARKIMTYFYFLFSMRPGKEWKCILYRLCDIPLGYICVYFPANEKEEQYSNSKLLYFFLSSFIRHNYCNMHQINKI